MVDRSLNHVVVPKAMVNYCSEWEGLGHFLSGKPACDYEATAIITKSNVIPSTVYKSPPFEWNFFLEGIHEQYILYYPLLTLIFANFQASKPAVRRFFKPQLATGRVSRSAKLCTIVIVILLNSRLLNFELASRELEF